MIHIDYQGGSHGHYLEFVCNKIAGIAVGMPFNSNGAAHAKKYLGKKIFHADHYSVFSKPIIYNKIISVQIDADDLLSLQQISLLRISDIGIDSDLLEIDTYNKLNIPEYQHVLNSILEYFFNNQIRDSYSAVKDVSWPNVSKLSDFKNLPDWIKKECIEQHKLELLELSSEYPDCPRSVLREFFQIGFKFPEQHGLLLFQTKFQYDESKQIYQFPFKCFYNKNIFLQEIEKVAAWAEIPYNCQLDIAQLHDEFLIRQPYKNSKSKCDLIIMQIQHNKLVDLPKLNTIEEAYINAKLNQNYFI